MPRVTAISEVQRDGQWLLLRLGNEQAAPPPELYLRQFRDTPTEDLDALAGLCLLGKIRTLNTAEPYRDLPVNNDDMWRRTLATFGSELGLDWHGDERQRHEVWERHHGFFPVHAVEVAYRVRLMQRVTDHLIAHSADEPVESVWPGCEDRLEAWDRFTSVTNSALTDFHVRVVVGSSRQEGDADDAYSTLYSAGMLQLVNDLATGETFRRCANETCRRSFVRQLGRGRYYSRSEGVRFCSASCAKAQTQREYRRRNRKGKAGEQ